MNDNYVCYNFCPRGRSLKWYTVKLSQLVPKVNSYQVNSYPSYLVPNVNSYPSQQSYPSHTIRYDTVYLTCSKKLTGSQLSPPHGTNKKLKCETKNKTTSMIGLVQSHCHEGSPVGKTSLRWEGFVEKVGFEPGVKE